MSAYVFVDEWMLESSERAREVTLYWELSSSLSSGISPFFVVEKYLESWPLISPITPLELPGGGERGSNKLMQERNRWNGNLRLFSTFRQKFIATWRGGRADRRLKPPAFNKNCNALEYTSQIGPVVTGYSSCVMNIALIYADFLVYIFIQSPSTST